MVNSILYTILILVLGEFIAINMYTHNFLASYIQVRAKRGRGVLVQVLGKNGWKFKPATLEEDHVRYKISRKEKALVPVKHAEFKRLLGVNTFMQKEGTDIVLDPDFKGVKGGDPQDSDNLFVRALHKPQIASKEDMLVVLGLVIILGVSIYTAYTLTNVQGALEAIKQGAVQATTITGGNLP